ncbi:MAG TPA: menaquinone biosynthesis decarboxylase, partial [Bacteroidales bacterium]|nr:menaquinone biosynthesis decarboxylase [Bacteroidales bacterium]
MLQNVASWMPRTLSRKGSCQEVIMADPDLSRLPVLTCWPADGGPFITFPLVHTRDPLTGIRNLGMYRMQVMGKDVTGMHWHLHKGAAEHFRKYREAGQRMPVSVTLGGDPVYTYAATAPLPENLDEYLLAGFLRNRKVDLVKCLTNDLEVPADSDFVIEGYVDPQEEPVLEGPFGDHTGFYSLADYYPRFHVTCISHRKNAIYPATIVGIPPMEDGQIGKATERIFLVPMKQTVVPELIDMDMPEEGVFHNITIVKIRKTYPGQAIKVMNSLWGAGQMMFNKIMIVVDESVDVHDYIDVAHAIAKNTVPSEDIHFSSGPVDVLDHSSRQFAFGTKMGIDATNKTSEDRLTRPKGDFFIDPVILKSTFPEITNTSEMLLEMGIPVLLLTIAKTKQGVIREILQTAINEGRIRHIPYLVVLDTEVDLSSFAMIAWIAANNIDPKRDCFYLSDAKEMYGTSLVIDATRKTGLLDHFEREWPNILVMDDATIKTVDEKWSRYQIGDFFPSPSLPYKRLVSNDKASV